MKTITLEDFRKLDIRVGTIISAEKVEDSDKLLKLEINLGEEKRQIVAGIAEFYSPQELIGKQTPILVNLEPRKIMEIESKGMILATNIKGKPVLLHPEKEVPSRSKVT